MANDGKSKSSLLHLLCDDVICFCANKQISLQSALGLLLLTKQITVVYQGEVPFFFNCKLPIYLYYLFLLTRWCEIQLVVAF